MLYVSEMWQNNYLFTVHCQLQCLELHVILYIYHKSNIPKKQRNISGKIFICIGIVMNIVCMNLFEAFHHNTVTCYLGPDLHFRCPNNTEHLCTGSSGLNNWPEYPDWQFSPSNVFAEWVQNKHDTVHMTLFCWNHGLVKHTRRCTGQQGGRR